MGDYLDSVRDVEQRIQRAEQNNDEQRRCRRRSSPPACPRLRRAREAADGPAAPGLSGRHHARQLPADRPRAERPDLSVDRRAGSAPRRLAPSARSAQHPRRRRRSTPTTCRCSRACSRRCATRPKATGRCSITRCCCTARAWATATGTRRSTCRSSWPAARTGSLQGGRHVRYPENTPFMNLCLTLLAKVDVHGRADRRQHGPACDL